jgi:hypothetical protein
MNDKEKNASIEYILSQGLVKPQAACVYIVEMVRRVGLRYIFWDTGYSVFFAAVTLAVVLVLFAFSPYEYRYSASVAVAPLLFLLTMMFVEITERSCGLYEIKQTCRYTIRQITVLRVVCYSIAGAVFTAIIAVLGAKGAYEFLSLFPLCLSALFMCAAILLSLMRFFRGKWVSAVYSAVWVFMSILFPFTFNEKWETALSGKPIVLSVAVVGAALLVYQISRILSEVEKYVVA